jgi:prepilin-type N-terminal cleavage/methylation domain-containing protein
MLRCALAPVRTAYRRGVTLIELIVVLIVTGVLAGSVSTTAYVVRERAFDTSAVVDLVQVLKAAQVAHEGGNFQIETVLPVLPTRYTVLSGDPAPASRARDQLSVLVTSDGRWLALAVRSKTGRCVTAGASTSGEAYHRVIEDLEANCSAEILREGPGAESPEARRFVIDAPSGLVASSLTDEVGLRLVWNLPTSGVPASYRVMRDDELLADDVGGAEPEYLDLAIEQGRTYRYRIVAVGDDGELSDPSDEVSAMWSALGVDAPAWATGGAGHNNLTVTWGPSATPENLLTGYRVLLDGSLVASVSVSGPLSHTFEPLVANGWEGYEVAIVAVGYGGTSAATVTTIVVVPPTPPQNFRTTDLGSNAVSFAWDAQPSHVAILRLFRGITKVGPDLPADATSASDTGITPGTTYSYTLYALDAAGNVSGPAGPLSVTPAWSSAPSTPTSLQVTVPRSTVFRPVVTWQHGPDVAGLESYRVRVWSSDLSHSPSPLAAATVSSSTTSWQPSSDLPISRGSYTVTVESLRSGLYSTPASAAYVIENLPPSPAADSWSPAVGTTSNPMPNPGPMTVRFVHSGASTTPYDAVRVYRNNVLITSADGIALTRTTSQSLALRELTNQTMASNDAIQVALWGPGGEGPRVTLPMRPQTAFSPSVVSVSGDTVTLRWYGSRFATHFDLYRATCSTCTYTRIAQPATAANGVVTFSTTVATPGTYHYFVEAMNSTVSKSWSETSFGAVTVAEWRPVLTWNNLPCDQSSTCWVNLRFNTAVIEPGTNGADPYFRLTFSPGSGATIGSTMDDIDVRMANFTSSACTANTTRTANADGGRTLACRYTLDAAGAALPTGTYTVYVRAQNSLGYLNQSWNTWSYVVRHDNTVPVWAPTTGAPDLHPASGTTLQAGTNYTFAFRGTDANAGMANVGFTVFKPSTAGTYVSPRSTTLDSAGRLSMSWNPGLMNCQQTNMTFNFQLRDKAGNSTTNKAVTYTVANAGKAAC